ncbi:MAG: GTP-binding protein, partial [Microgenomates group bacterium]
MNIRNFAIIAHVDHGKSTLADRLLELTGTVDKDRHEAQMLDANPISRERGITIKLAPVKMEYQDTILNLIDTPGHVDFSYEVERTLACVEGAILLVDATQGIQAQTIAHTYKALEQNIILIPAVNKIDMPAARVADTKKEIAQFLGIEETEIFEISAKTGQGVSELLEEVIKKVPPAPLAVTESVKALIFDSYYDQYRGVIAFVRIVDGILKKGMKVHLHATNLTFEGTEVGIFKPALVATQTLGAGEIGYIVTNLKDIHQVQVGDTITLASSPSQALPGYRKVQPMVFSSMFPTDPDEYVSLIDAMEKLTLNDSALTFEPIFSKALGSGLRVGFLGLLHADVVRQRLEREFNANIVLTSPTVDYHESMEHGKKIYDEPIASVDIVTPQEYVGAVMRQAEEARATFLHMDNKSHVYL